MFYFFRKTAKNEANTMLLEQILLGYTQQNIRPSLTHVFTDAEGIVYLPNMGFIETNTEGVSKKTLTFSDLDKKVFLNGTKLDIEPLKRIKNNQFLLCNHRPDIYKEMGVSFLESVKDSAYKSETGLIKALDLIEKNIPTFYNAIKITTREFAIFNSINFESFTALHYFGTAFLNLAGQNRNEVFFIEDIAHQSGHTMFYALTHESSKFLKPNRNALLKDFTHNAYDHRNIYGAFHGLFTYTTILHCLHFALENKWFREDKEEEALARLGFYYGKFSQDLVFQGDNRILTEEGWRYYDMFYSGFGKIKKEYYHIVKYFDYSNQDYNFNFQKFKEINQFQTV